MPESVASQWQTKANTSVVCGISNLNSRWKLIMGEMSRMQLCNESMETGTVPPHLPRFCAACKSSTWIVWLHGVFLLTIVRKTDPMTRYSRDRRTGDKEDVEDV